MPPRIGSASTEFEIGSVKDFLLFLAGGGKRVCNKVVSNAVRVLLEELESHAWVRIVHITETDPPEQVP